MIYVADPEPDSLFVINGVRSRTESFESFAPSAPEATMKRAQFPEGWSEDRVRKLLDHYETQSDEESVAEDEAAFESTTHTIMEVPVDLVPQVRELIAKRNAG